MDIKEILKQDDIQNFSLLFGNDELNEHFKDQAGNYIHHLAAFHGAYDILSFLLDGKWKLDIDQPNNKGWTVCG